MKKAIYLSLSVLFVAFLSSCNPEDALNNLVETCVPTGSGCEKFESCANTSEAWYTYDGTTYKCDGLDCVDAAIALNDAIAANCQ